MSDGRWEYRIEHVGGLFRGAATDLRVENLLNKLAGEGWELASHHRSWLTGRFTLIARRRRDDRATRPAS